MLLVQTVRYVIIFNNHLSAYLWAPVFITTNFVQDYKANYVLEYGELTGADYQI